MRDCILVVASVYCVSQGLGLLWKHRISRYCIPTADEVYDGRTFHLYAVMAEIMETFALRAARKRWSLSTSWVNSVLTLYGRPLACLSSSSSSALTSARSSSCGYHGLWREVVADGGVALLLLAHYFFGDTALPASRSSSPAAKGGKASGVAGPGRPRVDLGRVWENPMTKDQLSANIGYTLSVLAAAGIALIVDSVDVFMGPEDDDVMLFQVRYSGHGVLDPMCMCVCVCMRGRGGCCCGAAVPVDVCCASCSRVRVCWLSQRHNDDETVRPWLCMRAPLSRSTSRSTCCSSTCVASRPVCPSRSSVPAAFPHRPSASPGTCPVTYTLSASASKTALAPGCTPRRRPRSHGGRLRVSAIVASLTTTTAVTQWSLVASCPCPVLPRPAVAVTATRTRWRAAAVCGRGLQSRSWVPGEV